MNFNIRKEFYCFQCSLQFENRTIYDMHLKLLHEYENHAKSIFGVEIKQKMKESHVLSQSNINFSNSQVVKHINIESLKQGIGSLRKKILNCNICNSLFVSKQQLKIHIFSVHEGKKLFQCDYCDTSFTQKGNLKVQVQSVHEGKKSFACSSCGARFSQRNNLKFTFPLFMKERNYFSVIIVILALLKKVI